MKVVTDIRLGLCIAASVAFSALALQASAPANPPTGADVAGMGREITVRPQDTLWSIAAAALPPDHANVQQYMMAILHENPHAFANGNINGLIAGSRLRLPRLEAETPPAEAVQEAVGRSSTRRGGDDELKIPGRKEQWTASDAAVAPSPVADRDIRLRQRDDEIAQLTEDLAALRTTLRAERREREQQLARWRMAAAIGVALAATVLLAVVLAMRRRRHAQTFSAGRAAPRPSPEPSQQDDHHFGGPIGDHRVQLNLAQANMELGKLEVAREILEEVRAAGGASERREAEALLARIGPAQS